MRRRGGGTEGCSGLGSPLPPRLAHGPARRYKPPTTESNPALEDPTPDYMNLLGMVFSMCGLMLKVRHRERHRGGE